MHRDMKPSNVLLTNTGIAKLSDFGISRILGGTNSKASSIVGTPWYMPPEIILQKPYNLKSDIWGLGVLLYELIALTLPWRSRGWMDVCSEITNCKFVPLSTNYSAALRNIVTKNNIAGCDHVLAKEPKLAS